MDGTVPVIARTAGDGSVYFIQRLKKSSPSKNFSGSFGQVKL
jgi:hypothetical protein